MHRATKHAIRSIMSETSLPHAQAKALNSLRQSKRFDSPAGVPPNPAVLLAWLTLFDSHEAVRAVYADAEVGPVIRFEDFALEIASPDYEDFLEETGLISVDVREWPAGAEADWRARRGFVSLPEHSASVRLAKSKSTHGSHVIYREGRTDAEWADYIMAMARFKTNHYTEEEELAWEKLEAHAQVKTTASTSEGTRQRMADPCAAVTWLALLEKVPEACMITNPQLGGFWILVKKNDGRLFLEADEISLLTRSYASACKLSLLASVTKSDAAIAGNPGVVTERQNFYSLTGVVAKDAVTVKAMVAEAAESLESLSQAQAE